MSASGASSLSRRTPRPRPPASRSRPSRWKRARETITSPRGRFWSLSTAVKGSSAHAATPSRHLMSLGIDGLLEDAETRAAEGVEEALALAPLAQIDFHQVVDRRGDTVGRQGRTQHLANLGVVVRRPSQRKLVEFLALLIDTQNADMD